MRAWSANLLRWLGYAGTAAGTALGSLVLAFLVVAGFRGYHGPRFFDAAQGGALPQPLAVVASAREFQGAPCEPFVGPFGGFLSSLGCVGPGELPLIALGRSGYPMAELLRSDAAARTANYSVSMDNQVPQSDFPLKPRNQFSYFMSIRRLLPPDSRPEPGDLAFFGSDGEPTATLSGIVVSASGDDFVAMTAEPGLLYAQEVRASDLAGRGLKPLGFGRLTWQKGHKKGK
jgi:hypothetical protein